MAARLSEDRHQQIGSAVQDLRLIGKTFGRGDVPDNFHDLGDPIEASQLLFSDR